jgi:hypothetical protein
MRKIAAYPFVDSSFAFCMSSHYWFYAEVSNTEPVFVEAGDSVIGEKGIRDAKKMRLETVPQRPQTHDVNVSDMLKVSFFVH